MHIEEIEKFIANKITEEEAFVKISFKKRDPVYGLFVKDKDYNFLKSKNFWRIVTRNGFEEYSKSKNMALARMFSGSEFSKLTSIKDMSEI
ncbi:MAG: short-chain dehydrogenase [Chitinophagaceae bacterium]|jgi:hypothetical protein|nr:short-chain dehydrogenase [Chitinophagaceae bacterium]